MEGKSGKKEFILLCSCGCDSGFAFKIGDGEVYADAFESKFYSDQNAVRNRIKTTARLAFSRERKNRWLVGTTVPASELRKLRDFLAENVETLETRKEKNFSHFRIEYDSVLDLCFVDLMCDLDVLEVLRGRYYKCSEMILDKRGAERLIARIDDAFANPVRRDGKKNV